MDDPRDLLSQKLKVWFQRIISCSQQLVDASIKQEDGPNVPGYQVKLCWYNTSKTGKKVKKLWVKLLSDDILLWLLRYISFCHPIFTVYVSHSRLTTWQKSHLVPKWVSGESDTQDPGLCGSVCRLASIIAISKYRFERFDWRGGQGSLLKSTWCPWH